jgi:hypothetical protein
MGHGPTRVNQNAKYGELQSSETFSPAMGISPTKKNQSGGCVAVIPDSLVTDLHLDQWHFSIMNGFVGALPDLQSIAT